MKYLPIYLSWVMMAFVLLVLATITAIHRSQERTACYKTKQSAEECPKPANWELWLRKVIG